jgi:hypothetical protein
MPHGSAERGSGQKLPCPCQRVVKVHCRIRHTVKIVQKRQDAEDNDDRCDPQMLFSATPQQQGENDVKLFFNTQAPKMQKGFGFCRNVKISGFPPEKKVRDKGGSAKDMLAQSAVFVWKKGEPAKNERGGQNDYQSGKYAAYPATVKIPETESAMLQAIQDDSAYEVTGYNEEDINPNEACLHSTWKSVVGYYGKNGEGPQAVYIWTVMPKRSRRFIPR